MLFCLTLRVRVCDSTVPCPLGCGATCAFIVPLWCAVVRNPRIFPVSTRGWLHILSSHSALCLHRNGVHAALHVKPLGRQNFQGISLEMPPAERAGMIVPSAAPHTYVHFEAYVWEGDDEPTAAWPLRGPLDPADWPGLPQVAACIPSSSL